MQQPEDGRPGRLAGQVAIVTGGGSGIGQATAIALAREGASLVVTDLEQARVRETLAGVKALGATTSGDGAPLGLTLDVRSEADMQEMADQTLRRFGRIDVLVACAGILRPRGATPTILAEMPTAVWEAVLDTNLKGVFLSNRAVLPTMIAQRRGYVVNISSTSGRVGRAYDSAYCASKFGILGMTEALAEEVRPFNIRVQAVLPDAVDTPLWAQNGPIPRPGAVLPASRVADLIVFLLTLPEDTLLVNPVIAPFQTRRRKTPSAPGENGQPSHVGVSERTGGTAGV
jgi:NAD(P)-dependent dehydrogenase (short-subunit alcohol dehydrogenase family)